MIQDRLSATSPDLLRELLVPFIDTLMSAEADALCGAPYGQPSPERVNTRNGYRAREFDTRVGTLEVAIPQAADRVLLPGLAAGAAHPRRGRPHQRGGPSYLLGVSTRRVEKLVQSLGIARLSKSQVSRMAADLDAAVEAFRTRPLDQGSYTFVAADALVIKVREAGRVMNVHALLAVGVNADGHEEVLGLHVTSSEGGAGWLAFFRDLTACGLTGVRLVTSDAPPRPGRGHRRHPAR